MARTTRRVFGLAWLGVWMVCVAASDADAGTLATVSVKGKVTAPSGASIEGTSVRVELIAALVPNSLVAPVPYPDPSRILLGPHQTVLTDATGMYTASIDVPSGIATKHLYARVVAAKLSGPPGYGTEIRIVGLDPVTAQAVYRQDITLPDLTAAGWRVAFIQGTVRDKETKKRLRDIGVLTSATSYATGPGGVTVLTDADGDYFASVPWDGTTNILSIVAPYNSPGNTSQDGIDYASAAPQRTFVPFQLQTVDLELPPIMQPAIGATSAALVGRLIDAVTGKPIPHALVSVAVTTYCTGTGTNPGVFAGSITDALGRYAFSVPVPPGQGCNIARSITLRTPGAYLAYADAAAPYTGQEWELIGQIRNGDVIQHDFSLSPRTPGSSTVTLDDFEDGNLWSPDTTMGWWDIDGTTVYRRSLVAGNPFGTPAKGMQVDFTKHGLLWSFYAGHLSPTNPKRNFRTRNRLVIMVKGSGRILAKLKDRQGGQQELGTLASPAPTTWARLSWDLSGLTGVNLADIEHVMFFVEPGSGTASGSFVLDDIGLE